MSHQVLWEKSGCEPSPHSLIGLVLTLDRRGPNVMKCYWRDPGKKINYCAICCSLDETSSLEATDAVVTKDGWLRTGDVGYLDDEGFLYIKDRRELSSHEQTDSFIAITNFLYSQRHYYSRRRECCGLKVSFLSFCQLDCSFSRIP